MEGSNVYRLGFPPTTIPFVSLMNVSAPLFHVRDAISMWESLWKNIEQNTVSVCWYISAGLQAFN